MTLTHIKLNITNIQLGNKHNTLENNLAFISSIIFLKGLFHKLFFPNLFSSIVILDFYFIYFIFSIINHSLVTLFNLFSIEYSPILYLSFWFQLWFFPKLNFFKSYFSLVINSKKITIFDFLIFNLHKHGYHLLSFKLATSLTHIHLMWLFQLVPFSSLLKLFYLPISYHLMDLFLHKNGR